MNRRVLVAPLVLGAAAVAAAVAAALLGRPVWAAAVGAGLVLLYWLLEAFAWRRGEASVSFSAALGVALGGMVARLAVVIGALVVIGLAARPAFATAAIAFLAAFTLYISLRLVLHPAVHSPAGSVGAR